MFFQSKSVKKTTKPNPSVYYSTVGFPDSAGFSVQLSGPPTPGWYHVINYKDYAQAFAVPGEAHVRLQEGGKTYRNYKDPQKKVYVADSATIIIIAIQDLWVYNEADINDSILLNAKLRDGNLGEAEWSIDGGSPRTQYCYSSPSSPYYQWRYESWNPLDIFAVSFRSKPSGEVHLRFSMGREANVQAYVNISRHIPSIYNSYMIKELDTNSVATIQYLSEGINFSFHDKIMAISPWDPNATPPYLDTLRVSANVLMDYDWE